MVSVITTASNTVTATVHVGVGPTGVAVTPDGARVYVANEGDGTVSVIDTASNAWIATVAGGGGDARRDPRLCGELQRELGLGDRHGQQYRDDDGGGWRQPGWSCADAR